MNIKKCAGTLLVPLALTVGGAEINMCYAASTRPNFVTIMLDDLGFSDLGVFGSEIPTPNIDSLANDGIILTNFYSAPTSTPGRGMLFTGKSNHAAGIGIMSSMTPESGTDQEDNIDYMGRLSLAELPFPELLQQNGYQTLFTGKWDLSERNVVDEQDNDEMALHDPSMRGFDQTRALVLGGANHYSTADDFTPWEIYLDNDTNPDWVYTNNGQGIANFSKDFYSTEYYTEMAIQMLADRDTGKPFYLCVSYTAPHNPVQAPAALTAAHQSTYDVGWDVIRAARFAKQKQLGFWPQDAELPPITDSQGYPQRAWDDLDDGTLEDQKGYSAKEMAAYAAMVDYLDQQVGVLISYLKSIGEYENTVIMLYSDNGAGNGVYKDISWADNSYENIGERNSYIAVDDEWTATSNTPFDGMKGNTKEGGWHNPAIIHYPKWKRSSGMISQQVASVWDFAPMILDMAGIDYPDTYLGNSLSPMLGIVPLKEVGSAVVNMNGNFFVIGSGGRVQENQTDRSLVFEMQGVKGVRSGDWKLVKERCFLPTVLYNLKDDPFEQNDLALSEPDKLQELKDIYQQHAANEGIIEQLNDAFLGYPCIAL